VPSGRDVTARLVEHHLARVRELLVAAAALRPADLARPLRPGFVVVAFEGEEASAALMAQRLVATLEIWVAAMAGDALPAPAGSLLARFDRAAADFARIAALIVRRGAEDDAFVDALCEPPQSFTYGAVIAHVLTYGAIRREALAGVLAQLGAALGSSDPIVWEQRR
jgi:hypothetical protein